MASQDDIATFSKLRNQTLSALDTDLVTALGDGSTATAAAIATVVTAIESTFPRVNGTFTLSAAATKVVADAHTTTTSIILLMPTSASAGTLMGSAKSLYVSARSAGVSFTLATADGTNAVGNEAFSYIMVIPS